MGILGTSKVTTRHQITLIEKVREKLGVQEGDMIVFYEENGEIVIRKA
jgi:AbrB family looped-hinge helix DNA binding protein